MVNSRQPLSFFSDPVEIVGATAVLLLMAAYIGMALWAGPDAGWDLRNYHFYVGHCFLYGGCAKDVFPAQIQGWFNPLMDAVNVALMVNLPPMMATALLASLQSLNLPLLFIIIRQGFSPFLQRQPPLTVFLVRASALLIGATGAMTLSELGASNGDVLVSVPLLASVAALGHAYMLHTNDNADGRAQLWMALGGLSLGIAIGLKLTIVLYAPGLALGLLCFSHKPMWLIRSSLIFATASLLGLLISDGFMLLHLWQMTGNPFFPALNNLFHSNWISDAHNLLDERFRPQSVAAALWFPFAAAIGKSPGAEIAYLDPRFALSFVALLFALYPLKRNKGSFGVALLVFFAVGFAVWVSVFGIMRYAVPLELVSGFVIGYSLITKFDARFLALPMAAAAILLCLVTQPPYWDSRPDWGEVQQGGNWFDVAVPNDLTAPNQMFLIFSGEPMSYVIPSFPSDSRFVRMQGNLNPPANSELYRQRAQAIARHNGPLWTLSPGMPTLHASPILAAYRLRFARAPCMEVKTNVERFTACLLERTP